MVVTGLLLTRGAVLWVKEKGSVEDFEGHPGSPIVKKKKKLLYLLFFKKEKYKEYKIKTAYNLAI